MAERRPSPSTQQERGTPRRAGNGDVQTPSRHSADSATTEPTSGAWAGWVGFAGVTMIVLGFFNAVVGLATLLDPEFFAVTEDGLLILDFTTWGWTWLVIGALVLAAGFGVLAGQMWGRVVGITAAAINAVGHLAFMPAYPLWSILVIALDVIVIYALTAHGRAWANM